MGAPLISHGPVPPPPPPAGQSPARLPPPPKHPAIKRQVAQSWVMANVGVPVNEPVRTYPPGSAERLRLQHALAEMQASPRALPMHIDGLPVEGSVDAALRAGRDWSHTTLEERAAVFLRAAELLSGPWRDRVNAATILGQSKSVHQAEIDAACELIDFWRFNVHYAFRLREDQPISPTGVWNRTELRPLEGFVVAI